MIEEVAAFIRQWNMISPGDCVIAGVSGGADSVCMCCVLADLSERFDFTLRVVHVEHGIRGGESVADAKFVQKFCAAKGIDCVIHPVDVPAYAREYRMGEEEAARFLRYEALKREAGKYPASRIALAHHMEDNAETMLFQMARGSGLDGLCGIRPVRSDGQNVTYIRPLLGCSRAQIEQELHVRDQDYCTDATNHELVYSRNRIRHKVLPQLCEVNAQAVMHLNRLAEQMNQVRDYMDIQLAQASDRIVVQEDEDTVIKVKPLLELPEIMRTRLIHHAVAQAAGARRDIQASHIFSVLELAQKQTGRSVNLPYQLTAERSYDVIWIRHRGDIQKPVADAETKITAEVLAEIAASKEKKYVSGTDGAACFSMRVFKFEGDLSEIPQKIYTKWFDYDKIKFGFSIRTRRNQDYFVMDDKGHRKKLSDYFIDQKIPSKERDTTLLVADGSQILWVVGGRMGRGAQLERTSRMILELSYEGGTSDGL